MKKQSVYDAQNLGFKTQPQARYLMRLYDQDPEKYKWVKEVIKEFGMPQEEEPLRTYWEPPYNISPETPSYKYKKRSAQMKEKLEQFAKKVEATKNEKIIEKVALALEFVEKELTPKEVANSFWALYGNEIQSCESQQELVKYLLKFNKFDPLSKLDAMEQEESKRYLGDLIKGRVI